MFGVGPWELLILLLIGAICCVPVVIALVAVLVAVVWAPGQANTNLVACPDCGHRVSPLAVTCPRCGRPLKQLA